MSYVTRIIWSASCVHCAKLAQTHPSSAKNDSVRKPLQDRAQRHSDVLGGTQPNTPQRVFEPVGRVFESPRARLLFEDLRPDQRKDHLDFFANRLQRFVRHLIVLHGGLSGKKRRQLAAHLVNVPDDEERLVLATGRYIGEGFDDARLDTLFLAMPVAWKGTLVQYTGRLHRLHPRKKEVRIFDYVDRNVPMLLRMFEKRLRTYRAIGYARGEAPLGYSEPIDEPVVEYDEAALRNLGDHD